jgi:elongation factor G
MGPVTGSIAQRRGRIETMSQRGNQKVISGFVPLSEMFGYANNLRTLTQGRATFTMEFEHYEAVPYALAEEIRKKRIEQNKVR